MAIRNDAVATSPTDRIKELLARCTAQPLTDIEEIGTLGREVATVLAANTAEAKRLEEVVSTYEERPDIRILEAESIQSMKAECNERKNLSKALRICLQKLNDRERELEAAAEKAA